MKQENKITWKSPLMQISSVDIRRSKETRKDYAVVKVYDRQFPKPGRDRNIFRKGKKTTFLCFKDSLLPLFAADNFHFFEGEVSFDWGSTYLCITKLYDDEDNRLLRPIKKADLEKEFGGFPVGYSPKKAEVGTMETERKRRADAGWPCTQECDGCEDLDCALNRTY